MSNERLQCLQILLQHWREIRARSGPCGAQNQDSGAKTNDQISRSSYSWVNITHSLVVPVLLRVFVQPSGHDETYVAVDVVGV